MKVNKRILYILFSLVAISFCARLLLIYISAEAADTKRMYEVAVYIHNGLNPYIIPNFYIYPPFWMVVEKFTLILSRSLEFPFVTLIKTWPNIFDIFTSFVIYKILFKSTNSKNKSIFWGTFYLINPLAIIISSSHGQFDSIVSFFTLLSAYVVMYKPQNRLLSALFLGIAIAIKPNPTMIAPLLLLYNYQGLRRSLKYIIVTSIPLLITLIPFLTSLNHVLPNILGYSGVYDVGLAPFIRGLLYQNNANYWIPYDVQILKINKYIFLMLLSVLTLLISNQKNIFKSILTIYLLFITLYLGISAQYLLWIVPFAILARDKRIIPYTILATLSVVSFYLFFAPEILVGNVMSARPFNSFFISFYSLFNLTLWIYSLYWTMSLLTPLIRKCGLFKSFIFKKI